MKTLFDSDLTLEEAKELIKNGADVNEKDDAEKTPPHRVCSLDVAKLLIQHHADINARDIFGSTPLCFVKSVDMAKLFIKNGADLNVKDKNGASLIFYAFNIELIDLYITNGLDINDVNNDGHTSFYYYSTLKNKDRINLLINAGVNLNIKSKDGSILDFVNQYYNDDTSLPKLFIDHGAVASKIKTYYAYRNLFSEDKKQLFDFFLTLTSHNDEFFQMCLPYQNDQKNNIKMDIAEMEIL